MKTYLRYEPSVGTGIICSNRSNSLLIAGGSKKNRNYLAVTPGFEAALAWDLIKGELRARYLPRKETDGEVTSLCVYGNQDIVGTLVVGRAKGRIDFHDFTAASESYNPNQSHLHLPRSSLLGHSSAVTCICFNADGSRLATGSSDTYVVIWDPITETGLFRLRGHKDEVTCLRFCSLAEGGLISSSKDTTIKIWDLDSQICSKTLVDHSNAVWAFEMAGNERRLITGSSDGLLRSYDTQSMSLMTGAMNRQTSERTETMGVCGDILAIQSAGRVIEFYRIRSEDRASKKQKRRLKRLREKSKEVTEEDESMWTQDELELACVLRTPSRARSVAMHQLSSTSETSDYYVLITFTNNLAELYVLTNTFEADDDEAGEGDQQRKRTKTKQKSVSTLTIKTRLELQGHRTDIRCVGLGEDDELAITGADGAVRLWNIQTGACLRTMKCGFTLCCAFSPISLHGIAGTREGSLHIFNLSDGSVQKEIERAHEGEPVYSLDLRPDGQGMVTCGGDKTCKFWNFKDSMRTLVHARTLRLGDSGDAHCVHYTKGAKKPDQLKVCVALLDSTVKVFHEDSLEFSLSLYGHKLPVLTMDSSDDGTLLATGSTDKTIKIWGLDFGDCHRSIFAHDGSVTSVRFVPKTHYLVSCGRDGRVRYWDCDANLDRILSFDFAHFGDAWGLSMSRDGSFFLSVGKDKRVRRFNRTRDLVFLDEEKAKEIEQKMEAEREEEERQDGTQAVLAAAGVATTEESLSVSRKTIQAIEVGDRLVEVLNEMLQVVSEEEDEEIRLERIGIQIARTARQSSAQDLEDALVFLPYVHVVPMIISFAFALKARVEVETSSKAALILMRVHGGRMIAPKERDAVELLRKHMREALWELRDLIGTNSAGLRWMERSAALKAGSFGDEE